MCYSIIFEEEPYSVNRKGGKEKELYQKKLKDIMQQKYPLPPGKKTHYIYSDKLYILMAYFHKNRLNRDIDNILKYAIDSFSKFLYRDDKQIRYCVSQAIECKDNNLDTIDISNLDDDCVLRLKKFIEDDKFDATITYFECRLMSEKFYKFNLEKIWK